HQLCAGFGLDRSGPRESKAADLHAHAHVVSPDGAARSSTALHVPRASRCGGTRFPWRGAILRSRPGRHS
ncbi:hypothetical protein, partial [Escherichia coli]|uniref:hypothetical protein n=1 Tax=Escherichia coli TaxID=562 RepID=UPI0019D58CBD